MMAKGMRIPVVAAGLFAAMGAAMAELRLYDGKECLAAVRTADVAGFSKGRVERPGLPIYPGPGNWSGCQAASKVGYGELQPPMQWPNPYRGWQPPETTRGDMCLSGRLSECYAHTGTLQP